jgi:glycosyltransferase involved in cell wall biosynthesis
MTSAERAPQRRPRILIASEAPGGTAGISVAAEVLLTALEKIADVGVLYHSHGFRPTLTQEHGCSYERWRLGSQPVLVHAEGFVGGLVHRKRLARWDAVWAVGSRYAGAARAAGLPYVVWEATTLSAELELVSIREQRQTGLGRGWGAALHQGLAPLNDRLEASTYRAAVARFGMSEYSRRLMSKRAGLPIEHVGHLPAPPRATFLDSIAQTQARRHRDGVLRLLLVGRVADTRKNVGLFMQAVSLLRARGLPILATIVGPVTDATRGRLEHETGDWLTLAGSVDTPTLADAYRSHDLLVVSSRQEGYGFTVVEAMHAGIAIVSTRCGGPDAMIEESGGGLLTDHTPNELAAGIATLGTNADRRARMAQCALAYAQRVLSPTTFGDRVKTITDQMLSRPPLAPTG